MTKRRKIWIVLFGVLPAVIFLEACSTAAGDIKEEPIEIRRSETPVSTVISATVETRPNTEITPDEPGQSSPTTPSEQVERPAVGLSGAGLTYQSMILTDGSELGFALLLPEGFNPAQTYPVLFALPPGPQSRDMVEAGLSSYWAPGAAGRDWIVVSPIAPGGRLFFRGAEQLLPEFLEAIKEQLPVEGDRFHLAGISNGGISAFRIAIQQPELFHSMVVLPGFPADQDFSMLDRLLEMPVTMYVGEFDSGWVQEMSETQRELKRLQVNSILEIVPGNGHFISGVSGEQIFELLDSYR
jgi:pimeloyl-ACP methyl ester carboxylesterase